MNRSRRSYNSYSNKYGGGNKFRSSNSFHGNNSRREFGGRRRGFDDFNRRSNDFKQPRKDSDFDSQLKEKDIGVTEYLGSHEGFSAIIKSRYSDFQVNEIDLDGNIAKLTDTRVPKDPEPEKVEEDDESLVSRYRLDKLPIETWDQIHALVQSPPNTKDVIKVDVTDMTKEDRTKIHEAVKTVFGRKIVGSTVTSDEKKYIVFKKYSKNERVDTREKWPAHRNGEYTYFIVYKECIDTLEANLQISQCMQVSPSMFTYAGVKDRRAKSSQWFCAKKVEPYKLVENTSSLRNIHVGNFSFKTKPLKLGELKGNRFRIALRNVKASDDVVASVMKAVSELGFINYYGLQRFGNCKEIPTYQIGIELMKGNWKEACHSILKPRAYERHVLIKVAKNTYLKEGDARKAYEIIRKSGVRCVENRLLKGLAESDPNDYVNALERVPRNMRTLYIHSFQSYVWNTLVSRRIKKYGTTPIVGDLILDGEEESLLEIDNFDIAMENMDLPDSSSEKFSALSDDAENVKDESDENEKALKPERHPKHRNVKFLTESDLPNYTIKDIVMPLPGYDVEYPDNEIKEWYKTLLEELGLSLEMPKQRVKTYSLSGAYRKIVGDVQNFSWKIIRYDDFYQDLIRSDYDEMIGKPDIESTQNGEYKAVVLDFCMSPCYYATMLLREVIKIDTSSTVHAKMSMEFEKEYRNGGQKSGRSRKDSGERRRDRSRDRKKDSKSTHKKDENVDKKKSVNEGTEDKVNETFKEKIINKEDSDEEADKKRSADSEESCSKKLKLETE